MSQCRAADGTVLFDEPSPYLSGCGCDTIDDDETLVSDIGLKSILLAAGQSTSVVDLLHVRRECH